MPKRPLAPFVINFLLILGLAGCSGYGFVSPTQAGPGQTGASKPVKIPGTGDVEMIPYTGSQQTERLEKLKTEMRVSDTDLAQAIQEVTVSWIDNSQHMSINPKNQIQVFVTLMNNQISERLNFTGAFSVIQGQTLQSLKAPTHNEYSLDVKCESNKCEKIELTLHRLNQAKASILYRRSRALLRVSKPSGHINTSDSRFQMLIQAAEKRRPVEKTSVVVANGSSYARLSLFDKDENSKDTKILEITSDLLQTTDTTSDVREIVYQGAKKDRVQARLVGNNPETADLAFDLEIRAAELEAILEAEDKAKENHEANSPAKEKDPAPKPDTVNSPAEKDKSQVAEKPPLDLSNDEEVARIRIYIDETTPKTEVIHAGDCRPNSSPSFTDRAFFKVNYSNPKLEKSVASTCRFEAYKNHTQVKKHIRIWQGKEKYHVCGNTKNVGYNMGGKVEKFLFYMSPYRKSLVQIFDSIDVTPESAYLLSIESEFPYGGYESVVTRGARNSTASGPFQITETLAKDLRQRFSVNLVTYPLKGNFPNRTMDSRDHRNYLGPSALAAGTYFKYIVKLFPDDSGMWPLAYKEGQGAAARSQKCASMKTEAERKACQSSAMSRAFRERDQYVETTLEDIDRYNMAPCGPIDYAYRYLAFRFIGSDPAAYGFGIPTPTNEVIKAAPALFPNVEMAQGYNLNPTL